MGGGGAGLALARAGHSVTAIDPQAPEGPIFRRVRIEEFTDPSPVRPCGGDPIPTPRRRPRYGREQHGRSAPRGGTLVVVEFAWDRIDEATAEWALERLPVASLSEKPSWLGRRCQEWARGGARETRAPAESYFAEWASEEGFHSSRRIRDELGRRFVERLFEWVPLYPDLREDVSESDESAAIVAGTINATGFRYVGTRLA